MNELDVLKAQLLEAKREIAEKTQALANEHVQAACPVMDGMAHIFRAARNGDKNAKVYADNFLREFAAYQLAASVAIDRG